MKILALSDTHLKAKDEIPPNLQSLFEDYDLILHAGDFSSLEAYRAFFETGKLKAVFGNDDAPEIKQLLPERLRFEVQGVKIGVVHEGGLSINDTTAQGYLAREMEVDILIFGHLHRPMIEKNEVILVCPGSPTKPRMSNPSAVELIIENGKVSGRILPLEGDSCDYIKFKEALKKREQEKADKREDSSENSG